MAAKKKTVRREARRTADNAGRRLQATWDDTREAFGTAEAAVQKQLRSLMKRSGVDAKQAAEMLAGWRTRLEKERRKAVKRVEAQFVTLQSRARKERRAAGRMVDEAVQRALAALNIPSRHEVHELTRRVEDLSRKIDGFGRAPRRGASRRPLAQA
jgi:polyhydroxyalkanoate synthesis regulator phasin